jgi:hypothetical protein
MAWGDSPSDADQLRGMKEAGLNISGSDAQPTGRWKEPIEAVCAKIKHYLDQLEGCVLTG